MKTDRRSPARGLLGLLTLLTFVCIHDLRAGENPSGLPVTGQVKYEGDIPRSWLIDEASPVATPIPPGQTPDPTAMKPPKLVAMTKAGEIQSVAIWLENDDAAKAVKAMTVPSVEIDQKGSVFGPYVTITPKGGKVVFKNSDGINHNVRLITKGQEHNFYLSAGQEKDITFRADDKAQVVCDLHAWMRAGLYVVSTPYYAVSGLDGKFTIPNVPPGKYKVVMGHPRLKPKDPEMMVEVQPGKELNLDLRMILGGR